jgi:hypothetical protein
VAAAVGTNNCEREEGIGVPSELTASAVGTTFAEGAAARSGLPTRRELVPLRRLDPCCPAVPYVVYFVGDEGGEEEPAMGAEALSPEDRE